MGRSAELREFQYYVVLNVFDELALLPPMYSSNIALLKKNNFFVYGRLAQKNSIRKISKQKKTSLPLLMRYCRRPLYSESLGGLYLGKVTLSDFQTQMSEGERYSGATD